MLSFIESEVDKILAATMVALPTCSIAELKGRHVTFCRSLNAYCRNNLNPPDRVSYLVVGRDDAATVWPDRIRSIVVDDPEWTFFHYHNWFVETYHLDVMWSPPIVSANVSLDDDTVVIGSDSMKYLKRGDMRIRVAHIGGVKIGSGTRIGSHSVIHRAVFGDTLIGRNVVIGSMNNIGHGCRVGDRTFITTGVNLGGSSVIGKDCWLGMNSVVIQHVTVGDGVLIGAGAVVVSDIKSPGKYVGVPARRIGDWDGRW